MAVGRGALQGREVPFRTILATIGLVVATYLTWQFIQQTWPILQLILISAFFAMALNPAVDALQRRGHMPRGLATAIVVVLGIAILSGLGYLFIRPIAEQTQIFIESLPGFVQDAINGRGVIGRFIDRYDLDTYVIENQASPSGRDYFFDFLGHFGREHNLQHGDQPGDGVGVVGDDVARRSSGGAFTPGLLQA